MQPGAVRGTREPPAVEDDGRRTTTTGDARHGGVCIDGGNVVIPPQRLHHVVLGEPATFVVEFYRPSAEEEADRETVTFSTGLRGSPGPIDPE